MMTKAGGDDRGTDPRLVKLQDALATPGTSSWSRPLHQQERGRGHLHVIPKTWPADPKTADLVTEMRASVVPGATSEGASPPTSAG